MNTLIHRSHGIHEMVLHQVCDEAGLYADAGVEVELIDGTGPTWFEVAAAPDAATVAVGGVIADWLRGDKDWNIHFMATAKPLMWVVGTGGGDTIADLAGRRIAAPRLSFMPSLFLRLALERHGLTIGDDVEIVEVTHRPDRLGLLLSGDVDASLLGPEGLGLADDGFATIVYVGDHIEFPTVGMAARPGFDAAQAATIAAVMREGLTLMREDREVAVSAMRAVEPSVPVAVAEQVFDDAIAADWRGPQWAAAGETGDIEAVAGLIGVEVDDAAALRAFLHSWA